MNPVEEEEQIQRKNKYAVTSTSFPSVQADIHNTFPTLSGIGRVRVAEFNPTASYQDSDSASITYTIPSIDKEQIIPDKIKHEITFRIMKGTDAMADDENSNVIPVNCIGDALFKSLEVRLNNTNISNNSLLYPYRCYFEKRLFHGKTVQDGRLRDAGYYTDTDERSIEDKKDEAKTMKASIERMEPTVEQRWRKTSSSKKMTVMTQLHDDVFNSNKFLPPGTSMEITLERSAAKFHLISYANDADNQYRVKLIKCRLLVTFVEPTEQSLKDMKSYPDDYCIPLNITQMTSFAMSSSLTEYSLTNILGGKTPKKVAIAMVDSKGFTGEYENDPFNFLGFNVAQVSLKVNGEAGAVHVLDLGMEDDKPNNDQYTVHALANLRSFCNMGSTVAMDNGINVDNFHKGNVFLTFDILPTGFLEGCDEMFDNAGTGSLDLTIRLKKANETPVTILLFYMSDGELRIKKSTKELGPSTYIVTQREKEVLNA